LKIGVLKGGRAVSAKFSRRRGRPPPIIYKAFTTCVRPLLEYAVPVSSPYTVRYNQNRISTMIIYKEITRTKHLSYTKRLEFLNIDSLEIRRLFYDLVFIYKMLCGFVDLKFSDSFTLRAGSTTRGHDYKLFLTYSILNARKHFFCERVVPIWNNLECNIVDFNSIKRFKTSLLSCNLNRYIHAFSLVSYVAVCFNVHCSHIEHCIVICEHISSQYPASKALCFYLK